ncbi:hypothetical protein IWW52_000722 [Coemansia sp. RSA 2704]|nr:hypothetical protein IWW54_000829 [Coemansia sp. RSA 2705]KAJ2321475.1 hypothetical protein IWW52_000722 [Coemansia sp. RSA 2704]
MSHSSLSSSARTACEAVPLGKLGGSQRGWLYKYSSGSFLKGWKRRYFVLSDERLYIFKDDSAQCMHHAVVDLTTFRSVQQISNPRKTKHGLLLRSVRRPSVFDEPSQGAQEQFELELYAESERELNRWVSEVSKVFVSMDLRAFQSPLSSFDALVQRAGKLNERAGGSILNRLEKQRGHGVLGHSPSSSTLVSRESAERITMTPLGDFNF